VIHAKYLQSNTTSDNDTPAPLVYDNNTDFSIVDEHSRSNTSATSGSSSDNNDSYTFYENSNTPTAPRSSAPSILSPPGQPALPEHDSTNQLRELSCSLCQGSEGRFSRYCDLKYV
jgi:hypothetical protein